MFPKSAAAGTLLLLGFSLTATVVSAQQAKTTDESIQANVYELAKLEPTPERIAKIKLPEGFRLTRFAEIENPRWLQIAPDGAVYVSQRDPGTLTLLRDTDADGIADVQKVVAKMPNLHGIALRGNELFFVTINELYVAQRKADGTLEKPRLLIKDLPDAGQHPNRTMAFGPDGMLYISVGSTTNAADERDPEAATMLRVSPDGKNRKIFASGLRNTIGFGWHPVTRQFWGMDHGIDYMGNDRPREELNEIVENGRYGWPFVSNDDIITPHPRPPAPYTPADWVRMSRKPALTYTAHSAPLQMAFYTGNRFPSEYRNDAFVTMRGSWNRKPASGYEIVRIRFGPDGRPISIDPFLTGFLLPGGAPGGADGHIGRLCGLAVHTDGSLLFTDDTNNTIYRVRYEPSARRTASSDLLSLQRSITGELDVAVNAPLVLDVKSGAFAPDAAIPLQYSAYGEGISPALGWSGVPADAKSLVVMMEDPDALNPKPVTHWIAANLPPTIKSLPRDIEKTETPRVLRGGRQGANLTGTIGYYGPKPPAADDAHRYHFQVFALDTVLDLPSGFNRPALLTAMRGHVLARGEVVGTYNRD
ncbi:MAG: YbhB/YbcL family Raf kinase inhibitor-like protein [Armatimonadota bacterium]